MSYLEDVFTWADEQYSNGETGDLSVNFTADLMRVEDPIGPYGAGTGWLEYWPPTVVRVGELPRQQQPYFSGAVQFTLANDLPAQFLEALPEESYLRVTLLTPPGPSNLRDKFGTPPPAAADSTYSVTIVPWGGQFVIAGAFPVGDAQERVEVEIPNGVLTGIAGVAPGLPLGSWASVQLGLGVDS
jgi:hypothetical protein